MKKFSACCQANIHHQNGFYFCSNCIKILNKSEIRFKIKPFVILIAIMVFLYILLSFSFAHAPINKTSGLLFQSTDDKPTTYAIDYLQIKIIEGDNPTSVSVAGAIGNMQIMPVTLEDWNQQHPSERYTIEDMKNENNNVRVGKWMLQERIPEIINSANIPLTVNNILIAYNWGCGRLIDWYKSGAVVARLPNETQEYICKYWAKAKI